MKLLGGRYETHPAADLFPIMDVTSLGKLGDDIRAHRLARLERDPASIARTP